MSSNRLTVLELVQNIPESKKIKYLGRVFYSALVKYYNQYISDIEVDIDYLVELNFKDVINKDSFIEDLKSFNSEKLELIVNESNINNISVKNIRKAIINYYNIEFQVDENIDLEIYKHSECKTQLHDFQDRIRRKVISLIFKNQKKFLVHMPTGSGKTRTAGEIIIDFLRISSSRSLQSENIKILWIAQSPELCHQAYETIKNLYDQKGTRDITFGHFYDKYEIDESIINEPAIIFCGIQKLLKNYKKTIWSQIKNDNYLVIVDESHRSVAKEWVKALNFFVNNTSTYLLGLTATPGLGKRGDETNYSLSSFYDGNKISITDEHYSNIKNPIEYLVRRGFLANIKRIDIDSYTKLEGGIEELENNVFNFSKNTLKELSVNPSRNSSIINIIKENYALGKKMLVFTCGIEHNNILKSILIRDNIKCDSVDTNSKNRNHLINQFKNSDLNILLNYGVLTTGFDAPRTDICIIARPIRSIVMYSQMVGRISRGQHNKGNKENTLYTIKDNFNMGNYDDMFNSFNEFYK